LPTNTSTTTSPNISPTTSPTTSLLHTPLTFENPSNAIPQEISTSPSSSPPSASAINASDKEDTSTLSTLVTSTSDVINETLEILSTNSLNINDSLVCLESSSFSTLSAENIFPQQSDDKSSSTSDEIASSSSIDAPESKDLLQTSSLQP